MPPKRTIATSLQPRSRPSTPTSASTGRSTRSSGKAEFYVELEGSPNSIKRDSTSDSESDSSSESERDEVEKMLIDTPRRRKSSNAAKASQTKRSQQQQQQQLATPRSTPTKPKPAAPKLEPLSPTKSKVSSPLKQSVTPSRKRRASTVLASDDDDDDARSRQTPRKTPVRRGPASTTSPTHKAPLTPRTSRSASTTPSRSSSRIQRLPPNLSEIKNAPAALRSRLVGFHMDDEGYGVNPELRAGESDEEDADEERDRNAQDKGKGKAPKRGDDDGDDEDVFVDDRPASSSAGYSLPVPPPVLSSGIPLPCISSSPSFPTTSTTPEGVTALAPVSTEYLSSLTHLHLGRQISVLSGSTLPEARLPPGSSSPKFDLSKGVLGYPYLEGGYEEWERPLRGCLDEVVTRGMGNAVVVLGPRGVGKTMLIERTLRIISHVNGPEHPFVTVRLSGLVHTTDRIALRSIATQLRDQGYRRGGGEADDDFENEGDYSSNSATMTTLLRLLEPSSSASVATSQPTTSSSRSASTDTKTKPIVLIVDEFDLFAMHPRQSFLYCLLDIVQGNRRTGGVGVVGVSSRIDCLSLLEKRVRSRCQSHVLQMMLPSSLDAFVSLAKRLMQADEHLYSFVERRGQNGREWAERWNAEVERFLSDKKTAEYFEAVWRVHGNVPTELRSILVQFFSRLDHALTRSPGPVADVPRLEYADLRPRPTQSSRDITLEHLSTPELTVLIACKNLSASTADFFAGFNLEMVFDEYGQWLRSVEAKGKRIGKGALSREAFSNAFDTLRLCELVLPVSTGSSISVSSISSLTPRPARSTPFKVHRLAPREQEIKHEVQRRKDLDREVKRWAGVDA
ncbi:hypothetical protein JCM10212_005759 [Sporobolomyces blumeae]